MAFFVVEKKDEGMQMKKVSKDDFAVFFLPSKMWSEDDKDLASQKM